MTDALVNDKPEFVRLFTENNLNILDYLTNGRLESLYRSVSASSHVYTLLQRHLALRNGILGPGSSYSIPDQLNASPKEMEMSRPAKELSLYEVSSERVLGRSMHTQLGHFFTFHSHSSGIFLYTK